MNRAEAGFSTVRDNQRGKSFASCIGTDSISVTVLSDGLILDKIRSGVTARPRAPTGTGDPGGLPGGPGFRWQSAQFAEEDAGGGAMDDPVHCGVAVAAVAGPFRGGSTGAHPRPASPDGALAGWNVLERGLQRVRHRSAHDGWTAAGVLGSPAAVGRGSGFADPGGLPQPLLTTLQEDPEGLLWVVSRRADPRWEEAMSSSFGAHGLTPQI